MKRDDCVRNILFFAASTGGIRVLHNLFEELPSLSGSLLIVQHMPKFINQPFVKFLQSVTEMRVKLAADLDILQEGVVYVVPSGMNCSLTKNSILHLKPRESTNTMADTADAAMLSLQPPAPGQQIIGIVLTGLGVDGAAGIHHIKAIGGVTIAQSLETCPFWEMPANAVKTGSVDYILSPDEIAKLLNSNNNCSAEREVEWIGKTKSQERTFP